MNVRQLASRIDGTQQAALRERPAAGAVPKEGTRAFAAYLERAQAGQTAPTISNHAWQRIQQRGISMTEEQQQRLGEAMQDLARKGARDALLMRADAAFVVNVPNRTVVTALGREEMQQRVFTQIDSAMLLGA